MFRKYALTSVLMLSIAVPKAALAQTPDDPAQEAGGSSQMTIDEARAIVAQTLVEQGMSETDANLVVNHLEHDDLFTFAENPEMVEDGGGILIALYIVDPHKAITVTLMFAVLVASERAAASD